MTDTFVDRLLAAACEIAEGTRDFDSILGPGDGDRATGAFMKQLRAKGQKLFGNDYSEQRICGDTMQAVDFYFPAEATIVEVALGLPNPASEFEKDILKALMAQERGHRVQKLILISRPGGLRKCSQPGRASVMAWAHAKHGLAVEVYDLSGEPRRRMRRHRAAKLEK